MPKGKAFKGFSDTQMKRIAEKLGYKGPISGFKKFLGSNPAMSLKFKGLEAKARMKFAEGGVVDDFQKNMQQQSNVINQAAQNANQSMSDTAKAYQSSMANAQNNVQSVMAQAPEGVTLSSLPTPGTQQAPSQVQPQQMQIQAQAQQEATQAATAPQLTSPDAIKAHEQALDQAKTQYQQMFTTQAQEVPAQEGDKLQAELMHREATGETAPPKGMFQQYAEKQNQFMQDHFSNAPDEIKALPEKMQDISNQLQQKYGEQVKAFQDTYESKYGERLRNATTMEERQAISAEIEADTEFQNMQTSLRNMLAEDPLSVQGQSLQQQYNNYMEQGISQFRSNNPAPSMADVAVGRMEQPTLPEGGKMQPAMTATDESQFIDPTTGQITTPTPTVGTGTVATATADAPPTFAAETVDAAKTEEDVRKETEALKAVTGEVSEKAQVTAEQMDPTSTQVGTVPAAQIKEATKVEKPASRTLQSGEMVDAAANAQTATAFVEEVEAATANPSAAATVQGQLSDLMQDFDEGQTPPWAAGALRNATAQMAARGLSSSSLAGQAMIQAAMEAALPIAQADAQTQAQFEMQNLSNRQARAMLAAEQRAQFMGQEFDQKFQARVANAAKISDIANMNFNAEQQIALENARITNSVDLANLDSRKAMALAEAAQIANLETTNLNNRQQAAVQNAKSFLEMDMANLNNEQQTAIFKSQQNIQALLSDQAAENAARQFNATSENQTNQFFANLESQINQYNATQTNAMAQFNESNAVDVQKFNSQIKEARDQFNAQNQLVIAQSNVQWKRDIATADTAAINAANEFNAKAVLDMSTQAYEQLWQTYSDVMEYAWTSGESERDRLNKLMQQQLANDGAIDVAKLQASASNNQAAGAFFARALFGNGGLFGLG